MKEETGKRKESDLLFQFMVIEGICQFLCVVQTKNGIGETN